jgi:hypothetical protein
MAVGDGLVVGLGLQQRQIASVEEHNHAGGYAVD